MTFFLKFGLSRKNKSSIKSKLVVHIGNVIRSQKCLADQYQKKQKKQIKGNKILYRNLLCIVFIHKCFSMFLSTIFNKKKKNTQKVYNSWFLNIFCWFSSFIIQMEPFLYFIIWNYSFILYAYVVYHSSPYMFCQQQKYWA